MYTYSEKGIAQCLKEMFNTESPVVPESFEMLRTEGELGDKIIGEFYFKTEDGSKYHMTVEGDNICLPYEIRNNWIYIKSMEKKE